MIDIDKLRREPDELTQNLHKRGVDAKDIKHLLELDKEWRELAVVIDQQRATQNQASETIAKAAGEAKQALIQDMRRVAEDLAVKEKELVLLGEARFKAWRLIPNTVMPEVPEGGEADGKVLRYVPEEMKAPAELPPSYLDWTTPDLIDVARAAKISGSRFGYIKGKLARLQMALVSYLFDKLSTENFIPVLPPVMVSETAMGGMGYLDKHPEEIYRTQDNLYLVGTSEQSIGPMHSDEIFTAADLPRRYVGYSACFRREVGSHGKDVRGILRTHQFDKVEMFSITTPEQSATEHDFLLKMEESIMKDLELPYRVVMLAAGDLGAPSAKTYDIETWLPSEGRYRETHSTSNTTDFQARRLNIRVKNASGKTVKAHMLNGTALAWGRIHIMMLENHRQADGSVRIPAALHKYLPFTQI